MSRFAVTISVSFFFLLFSLIATADDFVDGTTSDPYVTFISASADASIGEFSINLTDAAERAEVIATYPQGNGLLQNDEVLLINGVNILLSKGFTQQNVIDRVNEFSDMTGVVAGTDDAVVGATRLFTIAFGSKAKILVISNWTGPGSAGFLVTRQIDTGANAAGTIGGSFATGNGNLIEGQGIVLEFAPDPRDVQKTVSGALGTVTTFIVEPQIGDVNLDGFVDFRDVKPFVNRLATGGFQCEADINQDELVNLLDVAPFVDLLTQ